jgi:hypothetical protein
VTGITSDPADGYTNNHNNPRRAPYATRLPILGISESGRAVEVRRVKKHVMIPAAELILAPLIFSWMVIVGLTKGIITIAPDIGRYRRLRDM